jgi:hypothetical protein
MFYQFNRTPQLNALKETIQKLSHIKEFFKKQTTYNFYSSSIIITYEANLEAILQMNKENKTRSLIVNDLVRVKMVDFAHVVLEKSNSLDENYLFGVEKLISFLRRLLDQNYCFKDVK